MPESGIGLYIHVPWCVQKCPYCDFNSHPAPKVMPADRYVAALTKDMDEEAVRCEGRTVNTVFIGGGTPSLFPPEVIAAILEAVRARMPVSPDAEITMEANPGTIERGRFSGYRDAGVNRVSLGAQSFSQEALTTLGRIHSAGDTMAAVEELAAAGLGNFNLDLMYALPGQSIADALADLRIAISLEPPHISLYQLTLEPGTVFYSRPPPLPDDDLAYAMQEASRNVLTARGYERYEVSAFAKPGRQCRHNLNYWHFGDYLGIGAGAHGKLTTGGTVRRTERIRSPRAYLVAVEAGESPVTIADVVPEDLPFEFMLNALRLSTGFPVSDFVGTTGLPFAVVEGTLERLAARGLMEHRGTRWAPTSKGLDFLNEFLPEFLSSRKPQVAVVTAG